MNSTHRFSLAGLTLLGTALSGTVLSGTASAQNTTISPPKPLNCNWYKAPPNRRVGDHLGGTGVINFAGITNGATNHYQCLDGSLKGKGAINGISQVAFHQYGATCSPCNSGPQSYASVTVTMAEFDYDKASATFSANLVSRSTVVLNNTAVNLPDWSRLPNSFVNSPYDLIFPFQVNYFYTGTNDLCTDIVAAGGSFATSTPATRTAYAAEVLDGQPVLSCSLDHGNPNGQGCRVSGRANDFSLFIEVAVSSTIDATFNLRIADGQPSQPCVLGLAPIGTTVVVPGWCQPVLLVPSLFLPGALNSAGQWNPSFPTNTYGPAQIGQRFFAQVASDDATQNRFILTNVAESVTPSQLTAPDKFRFQALSVADNTSPNGNLTLRAPVIQYTHL